MKTTVYVNGDAKLRYHPDADRYSVVIEKTTEPGGLKLASECELAFPLLRKSEAKRQIDRLIRTLEKLKESM